MSAQSYQPDTLPLSNLDYRLLLPLVGQANAELARYDGLLQGIPNPAVMLSPLTTQEAVLSSRIEGTQATVDEVLEHEAGLLKDGEKSLDIQEISNYRKALFEARHYLADYPIRLSFILALHKILLDSVRGENKTPGEFRRDQNWIGAYGCTIEQATFVPPCPLQLQDHLQHWESYLNSDDIDFLIQTAVMHAQFELLHPFKDGNGRIGRILIPLFLYQKKVLSQPMFYLSEYLESHRDEYYARLKAISVKGDWNGWIAFFLRAVSLQAQDNSQRVMAIKSLYDEMKQRIHELTRSQFSVHLLDAIFSKPIFRTTDIIEQLHLDFGIHKKTVPGLLRSLREGEVLKELKPASGNRPAVLCFPELLNIAEGRKIL
ncbi:Fic family protein [Thiopseudomonas acetoxidans]|uniref:Protein adenylyltransferase n=1 Tax=Thiopseudomonas acetoxidans TaxID=3041622 RepID=A0ABT7SNX8_9GAMM|nr:Fic/DOC family N-terminal domain-containing protein [Thiopseudomonas sp. CY1220]MDM7857891.1 Fic/DOC family N-terminal domain-containing protein [Thiopseudomonas sp. CY1220]